MNHKIVNPNVNYGLYLKLTFLGVFLLLFCFDIFSLILLEREEERRAEGEGKKINQLPPVHSGHRICNVACALTRNQTGDLLEHSIMLSICELYIVY